MPLPTGLVPVLVLVLSVGISVTVALGAHLWDRTDDGTFRAALRVALSVTGGLSLVGVIVVWAVAGGLDYWEVALTLLVAGVVALVALVLLPLKIGQRVVRRLGDADSETALRVATYGWPVAMLAVFGIFVAPGGVGGGDLLSLDGLRTCLAGFCGVSVSLALAVVLEAFVAMVAPAAVGLLLYALGPGASGR